jgi:hypothetical protein
MSLRGKSDFLKASKRSRGAGSEAAGGAGDSGGAGGSELEKLPAQLGFFIYSPATGARPLPEACVY